MASPRLSFILAILALLATALILRLGPSHAAFSGVTTNANDRFSAGSVTIADNDAGSALFTGSAMRPGHTETACIRVTYTGSLPATVRLYGTTTGTGLDPYLGVTVTRGSHSSDPGFNSCANFSADAATYITGRPAGVVYAGTLEAFPDAWSTGIVDPVTAEPETWTTGETHVFRLRIELGDNAVGRGKQTTQSFRWEARNA